MTEARRVLFVCLHGAAKSVIAAHHLQRLADQRGLALECSSAGLDPDEAVPAQVIAGLREDGIEPTLEAPRRVTPEILDHADTIVSFGCDLSTVGSPSGRVITWEDVPHVSDGFPAARDEIMQRLKGLVAEIESAVPRSSG